MPANWADTPEKEQAWKEAKKAFKDSYGREPGKNDWKIVMSIAKKIHSGSKEENTMKKSNVIEIKEEVQIGDSLLEKGDKIKVLNEESIMFGKFDMRNNPELVDAVSKHMGQEARVYHIYDNDSGIRAISNGVFNIRQGDIMVQQDKLDYFIIEGEKIDMVDYRVDSGEYFIEVYMENGSRITIDFK